MNIALLSTGFLGEKEATAITLLDFAVQLLGWGKKVTIISEKRKELSRCETYKGIKIYRIGFPKDNLAKPALYIYNKILAHALAIRRMNRKNELQFDIIHNFSAAPLLSLRAILSKMINRKAKVIQTLKSYSRDSIGNYGYRLLNHVDVVTVPTKIFAERLVSHGVKTNKIKVIPSHINTAKFFPRNRLELKKNYNLTKRKVILYYGSMWENKGTDLLIKAIPHIVEKHPEALFVFIPRNWPYAKRYNHSLLKCPQNVKMIDFEVNIPEYVALADVVVLPYITLIGTEGNPSCLLEAMACKTPIVTSNLLELKEITVGSVLMAEANNLSSLIEKVNQALSSYPSEWLEKAYLQAQKFSVPIVAEQFLDLYEAISNS